MDSGGGFEIPVRHGHITVARLVTGKDNTLGICKVADAGVFQTVELVRIRKVQGFADFHPLKSEGIDVYLLWAGNHVMTEKVLLRRVVENALLDHYAQHYIIEGDGLPFAVLGNLRAHKDSLLGYVDVAQLDVA